MADLVKGTATVFRSDNVFILYGAALRCKIVLVLPSVHDALNAEENFVNQVVSVECFAEELHCFHKMPRKTSDSISFVVQALVSDESSTKSSATFRCSSANLIESSNRYGYLFLSLGSSLHVYSVQRAEAKFVGDESTFNSDVSFKIEFPGLIHNLSLSSSESYIAVTAEGAVAILSVPNLLISVSYFHLYE